ncbi:MAG: cytochrome c biogenesis protein CcdA [Candidatus Jordarchaeum sp.]|uniref:cytochrome c biogenesis protein CcdA n=1 Tax=Candidatus Jordarchaeum sp. TaxID=2823881 RepID=UPI00404B05E4
MKYKFQSLFLLTLILIAITLLALISQAENTEIIPAPNFTAVDEKGQEFSLSDYNGNVVILHFTQVEEPVCIECLKEMKGQIVELEKLSTTNQNVTVITINIRKNPYSVTGKEMAERDFDVNVSWHWVEDFSPFPIANLYQKYWTVDGAFSNPGLVLIDMNQSIVGVYHIYCMGKGPIDGIQSAESLSSNVQDILEGRWKGFKGQIYDESITFIGIFALGILTAVTPCSLALLVAMISYVGSLQKGSEGSSKKISVQGIWIGIVFTFGMSLVFFMFGLVISSVGIFIEASALFYLIAGIILVVLGLNIFKPLRELIKTKSKQGSGSHIMEKGQNMFFKLSKKSIYAGAFFLGILFSIGWAPCAMGLMMPVFILILTQEINLLMGGLLLFIFGLGHGVPIIPLCAVTNTVRGKLGNKYVTAGKWMQKIFGIIIIAIGILMAIRFWGINFW